MNLPYALSLSGLAAALLTGCPPTMNPMDTGMPDGGTMMGPRGLVRWGSVACDNGFDGAAPLADAACSHPSQHSSNTGVNETTDLNAFRCTATVQLPGRVVIVGFHANETHDPMVWPGSIELRGAAQAAVTSPTTIGQTVQTCEVHLTENGHAAVGHCGAECTVTITNYYDDAGTISGTIRCGAMPDDSTPPKYRNLRQSDGVPGMAADFSLNGCDPAM